MVLFCCQARNRKNVDEEVRSLVLPESLLYAPIPIP
jgi:hypothetical protein